MRGRGLLFISVALNVALAAGLLLFWRARSTSQASGGDGANNSSTTATPREKVIPVYRKQFFSWSELESTNYDIYITNLRDIACPEETIHDIILADVNNLYDQRKAGEDQTPEHFKALDEERRALLTRLLGMEWDAAEKKAGFAFSKVAFTDPLLNELTPDARAKVEDILSRWSQQAVSDSVAAAVLEQQMRFELSGVLTPPQLEELLSRYSANAVNLNNQLAGLQYFKTTPAEFRNLFRATDGIDLKLRLLGDATDPATTQQRKALEQQRDIAIKNALGTKRYAEYVQLQDPTYRDAVAQAQASGSPPPTIPTLHEINQETALEKAVVQADTSLTDTQRVIQLKEIELEQMKAQAQAQGHELPTEPSTPPMPPMPPPLQAKAHPYYVNAGDTLSTIAQKLQVNVADIQAANPGINIEKLRVGQPIFVPMQVAQ